MGADGLVPLRPLARRTDLQGQSVTRPNMGAIHAYAVGALVDEFSPIDNSPCVHNLLGLTKGIALRSGAAFQVIGEEVNVF